MAGYQWGGNGCPPSDRLALCKAFIAKAVWDFATTRDLIDAIRHRPVWRRLCGGEALGQVPSESTFSRAFDPFSSDNRPQAIHEALIKTHYGEKIAGHISRDATAIHAREKATAKPQEKTGQSKKECWCGYKLHLDVIDGDRSRANRRRIRKPRAERREGRCVPENHDFIPSDGAKTVTPAASAIFPCRTPRGSRLKPGTTRSSASVSFVLLYAT